MATSPAGLVVASMRAGIARGTWAIFRRRGLGGWQDLPADERSEVTSSSSTSSAVAAATSTGARGQATPASRISSSVPGPARRPRRNRWRMAGVPGLSPTTQAAQPVPYLTSPESTVAASIRRCNPNRVKGTGTTFQTVPSAGVKLWVSVNINRLHAIMRKRGRGGSRAGERGGHGRPTAGLLPELDMAPDPERVPGRSVSSTTPPSAPRASGLMADGAMESRFNGPGTANYMGDYEPDSSPRGPGGGITQIEQSGELQFPLANPGGC